MLLYIGSDILEVRPQQVFESSVELDYPNIKLINEKPKPTKQKRTKQKRTKKSSKGKLNNGNNR
jgi:hypothetical protein